MVRKWFLSMVLCIFIGSFLVGCCAPTPPKPVKIVVVAPLEYSFGQAVYNSVQLALEEADYKAGEIPVELVFYDTSDPEFNPTDSAFSDAVEIKAVQSAIDDPDVVVYFGSISSDQAKATLAMTSQAGLAHISPSASWPGLTLPGYGPGEPGIYFPTGRRHFFRMSPTDNVQGVMAARWTRELGFEKIYVVHDGSVYSSGLAGIFKVTAQDVGLDIVGSESYDWEGWTPDELEAIATRIAQSEAEMLYFPGQSAGEGGAPEFISAVKKLSPDLQIMTGDGLANQMPEGISPEQLEGIMATELGVAASDLEGEAAAQFAANYEAAYGEPLQSSTGVKAYETIGAILQAIQQAKEPTREGVLAELKGFEYSGILGDWRFDENGDINPASISSWQVQDGEWVFVKVLK